MPPDAPKTPPLERRLLVFRVSSWSALYDLLFKQFGTSWVFRGQQDASWKLQTTFERSAHLEHDGYLQAYEREMGLLRDFYSRAHHYVAAAPGPLKRDPLEWAALLRHHGGPSRLMDVTHSPYVAAFFALEQATTTSAIWAIHTITLWRAGWQKFRETFGDGEDEPDLTTLAFDEVVARAGAHIVVEGRPDRVNARMAAQQGTFLIPYNTLDPFEENLFGVFNLSPPGDRVRPIEYLPGMPEPAEWNHDLAIVKIEVPGELRKRALLELRRMNITAATLFPDLDGFARSLLNDLRLDEE